MISDDSSESLSQQRRPLKKDEPSTTKAKDSKTTPAFSVLAAKQNQQVSDINRKISEVKELERRAAGLSKKSS